MFEKLLSLFERLVVAAENIAAVGHGAPVQSAPAADGPKPSRSRAAAASKKEEAVATPAADTGIDFLGGSAETSPAKKYERSDVKAALEKLVAKIGGAPAFEFFKKEAGVVSLNDLPEEKFATVVQAVEKQLK